MVKILPNVVMSNLAMNIPVSGENTVSAGTSASSAWALQAAWRGIRQDKAHCAIVASASFPYEYFNMDAYHRFFGETFFTPPLCEGASAVALSKHPDDSGNILGAITHIHTFKHQGSQSPEMVLASSGYDLSAYDRILFQPSASGNFLAASEPFGMLCVLDSMAKNTKNVSSGLLGRGLSVTRDYFGNYSVY